MNFLPHGTCLLWNPGLLALQVVSDAVIAVAYVAISIGLMAFVKLRKDVPFPWLFWMFGSFIIACSATHVMSIVTVWFPSFWTEGVIKALTAVISISTAIALVPLIPRAVHIPDVADLRRLNRLYEREQQVAQRYQEASLPAMLPNVHGFHFSKFYESGNSDLTVGGDWYDAMRLVDGRIVISIGDVTGSGLNAAVVMTNVRQVIRGVAHLHPDPLLMLDAADRALRTDYSDTFVTAFVAVVDPIMMTMTYASAGHHSPLIARSDGSVTDLTYRGVVLGLRDHNDPPPGVHRLEPGQTIVFYTDGLIESNHDLEEGERRLSESIRALAALNEPELATALSRKMLPSGNHDDVAILTMTLLPVGADVDAARGISRHRFHALDAEAARVVRMAFIAGLEANGIGSDGQYAAELVFGELIGNTVRYAKGYVEVIVDWTGPAPILHVSDEGPGFWHVPKLPSDLMSESGRGLFLVKALTADFTISKKPDGGSHARAVLRKTGQLDGAFNSLEVFANFV